MRVGDFRHKMTIQKHTDTQDSNGNIIKTWSTHSTWWAKKSPLKGREFLEAKAINPETTYRFLGWFVTGTTEDMRLKGQDGNLYDIKAILEDAKSGRRTMEIMAIRTNEESV